MKTLKNCLKCLPLLFVLALVSCKKDSSNNPENNLDITKFYIAGKHKTSNQITLPYIITFGANAAAYISNGLGSSDNGNYTYKDGVITIIWSPSAKDTFRISDEQISSFEGTSTLESYFLQKTPEQNALNGHLFSGSLKNNKNNFLVVTKMKFSASQYGETSLGDPVPNKDYSTINNASGGSNTGNNGTLTFFVLINGNLEVSRASINNADGSATYSTGTLKPSN